MEYGTVLAVRISAADVSAIGRARARIEANHALSVEREEHTVAAEHPLRQRRHNPLGNHWLPNRTLKMVALLPVLLL